MADEALHDRIEQYLLGKLPADEAARFEAEMATDSALADQVALQRLALMGMQRLAARDMRTRFEQWDTETDDPPSEAAPPSKAPINLWFWTSMVLLLLLAAGAFRYFGQIVPERNKQEQQDREIAVRDSLIEALRADYREKAMALDSLLVIQGAGSDSLTRLEIKRLREELEQRDQTLRELERRRSAGKPQIARQVAPAPPRFRGDQDNSVLGKARQALEGGKFEEAVRLLKSIPAADPGQAQVTQIFPYALFYAGKYREAIPAFLKLWEQDPDNEAMNAQGYLMLCYVAEGNLQEARQMRLVILQNPKHKFYKTAKDLAEAVR
jgi:tetratricopeptide (TPR) repeat protein